MQRGFVFSVLASALVSALKILAQIKSPGNVSVLICMSVIENRLIDSEYET